MYKPYVKQKVPKSQKTSTKEYFENLQKIQQTFTMAITFKDALQEARSIPEYRGDDKFDLVNFIAEVETVMNLIGDGAQKSYIQRVLISKIQGKALMEIRKIEDKTWDKIKERLKEAFGVEEKYNSLINKVNEVRSSNIDTLYIELENILNKINTKYHLDDTKPTEFRPERNESFILSKFRDSLPEYFNVLLTMKNVKTLRESYNLIKANSNTNFNSNVHENRNRFRQNNFRSNYQNQTYPNRSPNSQVNQYNNNRNHNSQTNHNPNENNSNPSQNNQQNNNQQNNTQQVNSNPFNNNYRRNNFYRNNNRSGNFSQNTRNSQNHSNQTRNSRNSRQEPMEVDEENFHLQASKRNYYR